MTPEGRDLLVRLLARRGEEIVEGATDWVIGEAIDLRGQRPREETRELVARVIEGNEAALLQEDGQPLAAFVEHVVSLRAAREFHPSTVLRGLLSFRQVLEGMLRAEGGDGWAALDVLAAVDAVYHGAALQVADLYAVKLTEAVQRRRRELEVELGRVAEEGQRALAEKLATIEAQRQELATLSSPVLRVWSGVLVAPLVGEVGAARAELIRERVLEAIVEDGAHTVLLDITGLVRVDAQVALDLLRLTQAARLLGARGMLVGVSGAVARTLVALDVDLGEVPAFASLEDGLREALQPASGRRSTGPRVGSAAG
ncbi:STAS domain-containing protein [Chondromyces apiculatus]|uniref:Sulfate transporter/antisigma-factor antagonist STAS n=1 Tax=Chondromyces apiculatus DSM 436 TaxID=1192034 RepID=A0A017TA57_9BACT|nr:STAS domain-containing protein [Chondromyces apiculatus]EYF05817.1 Sulfate transporter/antisigma-factor antagonist STAS [Chondromyces apiculatus DSM 436]